VLGRWLLAWLAAFAFVGAPASALAREEHSLDAGWRFQLGDVADAASPDLDDARWQAVALPHTWNAADGEAGGDYRRGPAWYRRDLPLPALEADRRYVLQFDGAALVADVWINGRLAGHHAGGFAGFRVDITALLHAGRNQLAVRVDNSHDADVAPLGGDFTVFGGLYRGVRLIVVPALHFDLMDDGGPGVYVSASAVSSARARLQVDARVRLPAGLAGAARLRLAVLDAHGVRVRGVDRPLAPAAGSLQVLRQAWQIERPHLWQGVRDPYLHRLRAQLVLEGVVVDEVDVAFGIRSVRVDARRGLLLNGRHYALHGVNLFHPERPGRGTAVDDADIDEDARLLQELGVTGLRLVHFQHPQRVYDLADRRGWLLWTEIPLNSALHDTPAFRANLAQQLRELVKQNFNHPAVVVWGLGNEVYQVDAAADALLAQLHALARQLDPSRPTSYAHCCAADDDALTRQTDLVAYNRYYGWYDGQMDDLGPWADRVHARSPQRPIALSEYGAGASVLQQEEPPTRPVPDSAWHPEQYQALFHEAYWRQIRSRPYLWASFVWVAFDLASAGRHEGDRNGFNDKGLATYDRKTRKDAWYWYQANWSDHPLVYITSRRLTERTQDLVDVKVYTNARRASLSVNGRELAALAPEDHVALWRGVKLDIGANRVVVTGDRGEHDGVEWRLVPAPAGGLRAPSAAR
jgi:beta-galactosidase/beta-glucuronidase